MQGKISLTRDGRKQCTGESSRKPSNRLENDPKNARGINTSNTEVTFMLYVALYVFGHFN